MPSEFKPQQEKPGLVAGNHFPNSEPGPRGGTEPPFQSEVFGNKAGGFGSKAAVIVACTKFSLLEVWPSTQWFAEVTSDMFLEESPVRSGLRDAHVAVTRAQPPWKTRCSQGSVWQTDRCRVSLGNQGRPSRDGHDPVDNLRVFAVSSHSGRRFSCRWRGGRRDGREAQWRALY